MQFIIGIAKVVHDKTKKNREYIDDISASEYK